MTLRKLVRPFLVGIVATILLDLLSGLLEDFRIVRSFHSMAVIVALLFAFSGVVVALNEIWKKLEQHDGRPASDQIDTNFRQKQGK